MNKDYYKTISKSGEGIYKEKGSKFIGLAFHVDNEEFAKEILSQIKRKFHDAQHYCYAFRINPENEYFRSSDDGEPSGTAGKPILNQIFSNELYNCMVIVVRYFGGTKLGVSGLIHAYKSAAIEALNNAGQKEQTIYRSLELRFDYSKMNQVMKLIKEENLEVINQISDMKCIVNIRMKKNDQFKIESKLNQLREVEFDILINK